MDYTKEHSWIKCTDRLPKKAGWYSILIDVNKWKQAFFSTVCNEFQKLDPTGDGVYKFKDCNPTHWQPAPLPLSREEYEELIKEFEL